MEKRTFLIFGLFVLTMAIYYFCMENFFTNEITTKKEDVLVQRVIDGDTIELKNIGKLRLLGINTPEKGTFLFNESYSFTKKIEGNLVDVEITGIDKYGRNLGYIFYQDRLFNEEILLSGLAHLYVYEKGKYMKRLVSAEKTAQNLERGIWQKSSNYGCIILKEFIFYEGEKRCTNNEKIILQNFCNSIEIYLKDDATHDEKINISRGLFEKNFSCTFNDEGDSLYILDNEGLIIFKRYS